MEKRAYKTKRGATRKLPTGSKLVCRRGRSYILMGDGSIRREIFKDGRVRASKKARLKIRRARR